jgi:hypothetical protein
VQHHSSGRKHGPALKAADTLTYLPVAVSERSQKEIQNGDTADTDKRTQDNAVYDEQTSTSRAAYNILLRKEREASGVWNWTGNGSDNSSPEGPCLAISSLEHRQYLTF